MADGFAAPGVVVERPVRHPDLKYEVPMWSCACPAVGYHLEVLKGGVEVDDVSLVDAGDDEGWLLIGRLPPDHPVACHMRLLHPSISRQHAVLQMKKDGKLFVFDLGSTHGTFMNKRRLKPRAYVPLQPGDILRFGQSSRIYHVAAAHPEALPQKPQPQEAPVLRLGQAGQAAANEEGEEEEEEKEEKEDAIFSGSMAEMEEFMKKKGKYQRKLKKQQEREERTEAPKRRSIEEERQEMGEESSDDEGLNDGEEDEGGLVRGSDLYVGATSVYGDEDDEFFDRAGSAAAADAARKRAAAVKKKTHVHTAKSLAGQLAAVRQQMASLEADISNADLDAKRKGKQAGGGDEDLDGVLAMMMAKDMGKKKAAKRRQLRKLQEEKEKLERLMRVAGGSLDAAMPLQAKEEIAARRAVAQKRRREEEERHAEEPAAKVVKRQAEDTPAAATRRPVAGPVLEAAVPEKPQETAEAGETEKVEQKKEKEQNLRKEAEAVEQTKGRVLQPVAEKEDEGVEAVTAWKDDKETFEAWVPPQGQTGDGKTHLNAKFGY